MEKHGFFEMNNIRPINIGKFVDPAITADGSTRAYVGLSHLDTLWINTGTLCNLSCANCYIESTPTNDRLEYITLAEVQAYLDEIEADISPTSELITALREG